MNDQVEISFSVALRDLAASLKPSDEELREGNILTQRIFNILKDKSRFHINHTIIAGSVGKRTTIASSDIDGILFLNNEVPLFKDVLDEWEDILELAEGLNVQTIRKTRYSIQFICKSYDFDLLPAPNFVRESNLSGEERMKLQQKRALAKIFENPERYSYLYSTALSQSVVQFIRKQEGFGNEMIRIAKFWYKTLHIPEYVSGAKQLIELVTIHAVQKERASGAPTNKMHLRTFGRVLDAIIKFDSLQVVFMEEYETAEVRTVAKRMSSTRPSVLDPSNPHNNLAKSFTDKPDMKNLLIPYARESKQRLQRILNEKRAMNIDAIAYVFECQPKVIPNLPRNIAYAGSLVDLSTEPVRFPDKKIRNDQLRTDKDLMRVLDVMQMHFMTLIDVHKALGVNLRDFQEHLTRTVDQNVHGRHHSRWIPASSSSPSDCHENYDVTFTLPFGDTGHVKISLKDFHN